MTDLTRILAHARIPELPNPYYGKVRDCYDLPDDSRILISSDRISAFDRILACIPFKGQVLTQIARYWFDRTGDICPNHVLAYPDPNVVVGKRLTILPVEIVVRGYLDPDALQEGRADHVRARLPRWSEGQPGTARADHHPDIQGLRRRP